MNPFHIDLTESLKTGFLDQLVPSKEEFVPQLLVNDYSNGKKVLTTLLQELGDCKEFRFSVAFATKGGVATIINTLKELEEKKISGKILVSQYQNFTEPEALRTLLRFTNIELRIAVEGNFHAKGYLFRKTKGYSLIIGSSNLTDRALCANKEWNLKVSATENSALINIIHSEFKREFDSARPVDLNFIEAYETIYASKKNSSYERQIPIDAVIGPTIHPNTMQVEALANLAIIRAKGKGRALLISATATGKTYLSAFDVKNMGAKKCLFIVHRANIAETALKSYKRIFGKDKKMGMYSGERREIDADFLFSTVQTICRDQHLSQFTQELFDYIVIDETHRAGAESYQKIINYFKPKFLLGMTATPERTDGFNIFKQFNYDIAYEIRLQRALKEEMLCPFHYYGVTDVWIEDRLIKGKAAFNSLVSEQRVDHIIEKAKFYGCDNGCVRGLVFCSSLDESKLLADALKSRGYKTKALSGDDSPEVRARAIQELESNDEKEKLDYIFSVDIFNEGIDIPKVNQIILLRPTNSAIVYVQQLGRGLRKAEGKAYLTVLDFIGNYTNNYLIPIALFGDTSYNKDTLRKLMTSGSSLIPGASTVNFDKIARDRIYRAIDTANLSLKKDLIDDYRLLKHKIGHIPRMVDFIEHGSRDPFLYVDYSKSYFNFISQEEDELKGQLSVKEMKLLELFSLHIADAKRIEEVVLLKEILRNQPLAISAFKDLMQNKYGINLSDKTIESCLGNINFEFIKAQEKIVYKEKEKIRFQDSFLTLLQNDDFKEWLIDALDYAEIIYDRSFDKAKYVDGFILYHKYSRKDVCRILNWKEDEHTTVYGYKVKNGTCPIFVNYHKEEGIVSTTKYNDRFLSQHEFEWMSKSQRTLESKDILQIQKESPRLPLFIKKNNDEGSDFYYMGEVKPIKFEQTTIKDDNGKSVPIVKVNFALNPAVDFSLYQYLVHSDQL